MRGPVLLALVALAMPTAMLATTIDFNTGKEGTNGTINGHITNRGMFSATLVGDELTVNINVTSRLTQLPMSACPVGHAGGVCFIFPAGTVTVSSGRSAVFTNGINAGGGRQFAW